MIRRAPGHAVLSLLILFLVPAAMFAQSSDSSPNAAATPSGANQDSQAGSKPLTPAEAASLAFAFRNAHDPELEAISMAAREQRFLDAEKLVDAAIEKEESKSTSSLRLERLLGFSEHIESQLGHYPRAISALQRVIAMDRAQGASGIPQVVWDLQRLALYYRMSGDDTASAQVTEEELALARQNPGVKDSELLRALTDAARAYEREHRTTEAKVLHEESIRICEAQAVPREYSCAPVLAQFYRETGQVGYGEETLLNQAAETPTSPDDAGRLSSVDTLVELAYQYERDQSYALEEATFRKAIAVAEASGENTARSTYLYDDLGRTLELEGRNDDAEAAYRHAIDLSEHAAGPFRLPAIESLSNTPLPDLYRKEGRVSDAEAVLKRVLADQEQVLDQQNERLAQTLLRLAEVKLEEGEYSEVDGLCDRALKILEADYGTDSPRLIRALRTYSSFARRMGDTAKARAISARADGLEAAAP